MECAKFKNNYLFARFYPNCIFYINRKQINLYKNKKAITLCIKLFF